MFSIITKTLVLFGCDIRKCDEVMSHRDCAISSGYINVGVHIVWGTNASVWLDLVSGIRKNESDKEQDCRGKRSPESASNKSLSLSTFGSFVNVHAPRHAQCTKITL